MHEIFASPLFGICITILGFKLGLWAYQKLKSPLANPLLIAFLFVVLILEGFDIPYAAYDEGSASVSLFIAPITTVLALSIYRQRRMLVTSFFPVVLGTLAGALAAMASVVWTSNLLGLDQQILSSLLSKSVTTPVAVALTTQFGGIPALTIASTLISGLAGNLLAPVLATVFRVKDPIALGVGIGACSHALGTSKAFEIGEVQGAMSSISISLSAVWTVLLAPLFF